jgi:hypothetical protein
VQGWKLCQIHQRPEPRTCEDIGTWMQIHETIALSAVFVNAGLVAFTGTITAQYDASTRVWIFLGMILLLIMAKDTVAFFVPDIPGEVTVQLARQKFISDKVIHDMSDDAGWDLDKATRIETNFTVKMIDDDPL